MIDYKKGIRSELSKQNPNWGFIETLVKKAEKDYRQHERHCINVESIVCQTYGVSYSQLLGSDKKNKSVWARYFMFDYRKELGESLKSIAHHYNRKDKSTVLTGLRTHSKLLEDQEYENLNKIACDLVIDFHKTL